MTRSSSGVYSLPSGYEAVTNTVITAAKFNNVMEDLQTEQRAARPISAGGTGGTTTADALTNLGVTTALSTKRNTTDMIPLAEVTGLSNELSTMVAATATAQAGVTGLAAIATTSSNGLLSSADKIRLDGISDGATPPQTAQEIQTKLNTLNDLDADTLGGVSPSNYARTNLDTTIANKYTFNHAAADNPITISGSSDAKIKLSGATDPKISFDEGSSEKAKVGWNSTLDRATLENTIDNSALLVSDLLEFTPDGTTQHKVFHKGNTVGATQNVMETKLGLSKVCVTDATGNIVASNITTTELDFLDNLATNVNSALGNSSFPSGTRMVFNQASAPEGWTKSTTQNDKALRVVSGNTVNAGGSVGLSNLVTAGTLTSSLEGEIGTTTLSSTQFPLHSHAPSASISIPRGTEDSNSGTYGLVKVDTASTANGTFTATTSSSNRGGTTAHGHGKGTLSVDVSFTEGTTNLNLAYVDVIIAQKT